MPRPRKPDALTAAERQRRHRLRHDLCTVKVPRQVAAQLDALARERSLTGAGDSTVQYCFGGAPFAVAELARRDWSARSRSTARRTGAARVVLGWPRAAEDTRLDRAVGCLLGQVIGDALGSLVEFRSSDEIARQYPLGVRDLVDGGVWDTIAGQPTDDSELALGLARTLLARGGFDAEAVASTYGRWYRSRPFDIGGTTRQALSAAAAASPDRAAAAARAAADSASASNGSLMRVAPIGIAARSPQQAATWAAMDSSLSHPNGQAAGACAAYAAALCAGILGNDAGGMFEAAVAAAEVAGDQEVLSALRAAEAGRSPTDFAKRMGWVLIALQNSFRHLLYTESAEEALVATVGAGGDTDTNGAVVGALLGAARGRTAWPARWSAPILACRPIEALGALQPRPPEYWPDDVPELAEGLLLLACAGQLDPTSVSAPADGGNKGSKAKEQTVAPGAGVHPRTDDRGRSVPIARMTAPSSPKTWQCPTLQAVFVPDGEIPDVLGGIPLGPACLPEDQMELAALRGSSLGDPPLPPRPVGKSQSAGAVVVERDGRIWLFEPTNHFGGVERTFPKGRVEPGANLRETAVREVFEETGLLIALGAFLADVERTTTMTRYFLARRVAGTPAAMGWEAQSVCLVPGDGLAKLPLNTADRRIADILARKAAQRCA